MGETLGQKSQGHTRCTCRLTSQTLRSGPRDVESFVETLPSADEPVDESASQRAYDPLSVRLLASIARQEVDHLDTLAADEGDAGSEGSRLDSLSASLDEADTMDRAAIVPHGLYGVTIRSCVASPVSPEIGAKRDENLHQSDRKS